MSFLKSFRKHLISLAKSFICKDLLHRTWSNVRAFSHPPILCPGCAGRVQQLLSFEPHFTTSSRPYLKPKHACAVTNWHKKDYTTSCESAWNKESLPSQFQAKKRLREYQIMKYTSLGTCASTKSPDWVEDDRRHSCTTSWNMTFLPRCSCGEMSWKRKDRLLLSSSYAQPF